MDENGIKDIVREGGGWFLGIKRIGSGEERVYFLEEEYGTCITLAVKGLKVEDVVNSINKAQRKFVEV